MALGVLIWSVLPRQNGPRPSHTARLTVVMPQDLFVDPFSTAISPDAAEIAFVATPPQGKPQLWVRLLSSLSPQSLAGTENASLPFWSADSRHIAFFADGKLKRIPASGGSVTQNS